jgi:hypothetical protein
VARGLLCWMRMNPLPYDALALPFGQPNLVIDATPLLGGLAVMLAFGGIVILVGAAWRSRLRKHRTRTPVLAAVIRPRAYAPDSLGYGESQ